MDDVCRIGRQAGNVVTAFRRDRIADLARGLDDYDRAQARPPVGLMPPPRENVADNAPAGSQPGCPRRTESLNMPLRTCRSDRRLARGCVDRANHQTLLQCPGGLLRTMALFVGGEMCYQMLSVRSSIQRQSGCAASSTQTGLPSAPARWATDVSTVITRSRFSMSAAMSAKC